MENGIEGKSRLIKTEAKKGQSKRESERVSESECDIEWERVRKRGIKRE